MTEYQIPIVSKYVSCSVSYAEASLQISIYTQDDSGSKYLNRDLAVWHHVYVRW